MARTYQRIGRLYKWPGMKRDIEKYISACEKCQKNKLKPRFKAPLVVTDTPSKAFEKCAVDIVGPLPKTNSGNVCILTFQDLLTKYSAAIPLPNQQASEVAKALVTEIICKFGTPEVLLSDQGTNFLSATLKDVCKLLKIKKIQTTSYHPESNGALERSHRTLAEYLKNFGNEDQEDWDAWLPYAMFTYNTTPHSATGHTPFELVFGRSAEIPTAMKREPRAGFVYDDYAHELRERLRFAWTSARNTLIAGKEKTKTYHDKSAKSIEFRMGDKVLLRDETIRQGRSKKLTPQWIGPYEVVDKISDVNVSIRKGKKLLKVHVNRLKHFIEQ